MGLVQFDPTISVGAIINVIWMTGVACVILVGWQWRIKNLEANQKKMDAKLDTMTDVLTTIARQDERLKAHDTAIEDLKRGRGFIFEPGFGGGSFPPSHNS